MLGLLTTETTHFAGHARAPQRNDPALDFSALAYTLDLLLPIINLGQEDAWSPHGLGQIIAYALVIAGWVLATAVIAGITRVRTRN